MEAFQDYVHIIHSIIKFEYYGTEECILYHR